MKTLLIIFLLLILPVVVNAQTAAVTATIQDPSGQLYSNGICTVQFQPTFGVPGPFKQNGATFNQQPVCSINTVGVMSVTVTRNDFIQPTRSSWNFTICPNATSTCVTVTTQIQGAGAVDISTTINAAITSNISVAASQVFPRAYKDSELILTPNPGQSYWDTTLGVLKIFDGSVFQAIPANNASPTFNNLTVTNNETVGGTLGVTGQATLNGGLLVKPSFNNICIPVITTDIGAAINTCLAQGSGVDVWITPNLCGTTITTQILVNNLSYFKIHGPGGTGYACTLTNGVVGNPAEPGMKITGTSSFGVISNLAIQGNNTAPGAGATGNSISIIGTGATPAFITLDHVAAGFTKGNGKDGTGASMPAAAVYVYKSLDVHITHGNFQGNQQGIVFDNGSNNAQVEWSEINGNTVTGIKAGSATNVEGIEIGPRNDIEANGTNTTDHYLDISNCPHCKIHDNWFEANRGDVNFGGGTNVGELEVDSNLFSQANGINASAGDMFAISSGIGVNFHDNRLINGTVGLVRYIFVNPNTNGMYSKFINNTFEQFAGVGATAQIGIQLAGPASIGGCIVEGNQFGLATASGTQNFSNAAVLVQSGNSGCRVANNTCFTTSGTIAACVAVSAGATNTTVENTNILASGAGVITNAFTDAGTNTQCLGAGCPFPISLGGKAVTQTIANSTATMTTALIGAGACGSTVTIAASGAATTDTITWAFNAAPAANPAELVVSAWPTANNVNFQYCNPTAAGITPNAATLNWRVIR